MLLHDDNHEIDFTMVMISKMMLLNLDSADVETSLAGRHVQWFKVGHFYICLLILMDLAHLIEDDDIIENEEDLKTHKKLGESKSRKLWNSDNQFIVCCALPVSKYL